MLCKWTLTPFFTASLEDPATGGKFVVYKNSWQLDRLSPDGCRALGLAVPEHLLDLCKGTSP